MSLWRIAWKNMKQRALASSLTALSMALGVAVMVCVIVIHAVVDRQFSQEGLGFELIIGGKGGDQELVLNTVYHLGQTRYLLPYTYYRKFVDGEYSSVTKVAVPYCLGDSFDPSPDPESPGERLYRVVATTPDLFDKIEYGMNRDNTPKRYTFREGRNFKAEHAYEAVLGSVVAAQSGVRVGDLINPTHGISGKGDRHDSFEVVGVLNPTGTANDRAVFVNVEGFYLLEGHALKQDDASEEREAGEDWPAPSENLRGALAPVVLYDREGAEIEPLEYYRREVASILVKTTDSFGSMALTSAINKNHESVAKAVSPVSIVERLLDGIVEPVRLILMVLTVLIVVVASISILVSIYNSMNERAHDIAVMRALGSSRAVVMMIILTESVLLSLAGGVLGILMGHCLIGLAAPYVEDHAGVMLAFWEFDPLELVVIPGLIVLATLAGLIPAIAGYRTDVAKALSGVR